MNGLTGFDFNRHDFTALINGLVAEHGITSILETGTYRGAGTTQVLAATGVPVTTIECNHFNYATALLNLAQHHNVTCLHGYSLTLAAMRQFIVSDDFVPPPDIALDVPDEDRVLTYLQEIEHGGLPENLLITNLRPQQLVFLDSAGGVGLLEFQAVLAAPVRPLLLVMDDVLHYKHYRSVQVLVAKGYPYVAHSRWGYCPLC